MTREQILENEIIDDILQWSSDRFYKTFGAWLETVVVRQKEAYQLKLKTIWRNRKWYAFRDTGEQFENDTMLIYFDSKKIKKYSLSEMESIFEKIEDETLYSNPKRSVSTDR
ncbi:MAG: hypothetical protein M9888_03895 [Chitinophagales bacterium]|nr:hypothetical protein [Chitinophagales bacterium]